MEFVFRGSKFVEFATQYDLNIVNEGTTPTFYIHRGDKLYTGIPDLTACSTGLLDRVKDWHVSKTAVTLSDHRQINFNIELGLPEVEETLQHKQINPETVAAIETRAATDELVDLYTNTVLEVCEQTIPVIPLLRKGKKIIWWTEELTNKKQEMIRCRNRIRKANPVRKPMAIEQYKKAKEEYKELMQSTINASWVDFCTKQEKETVWQRSYRVLKLCEGTAAEKLLRLSPDSDALDPVGSAELLAKTFYPWDEEATDSDEQARIRSEVLDLVYGADENQECPQDCPSFTLEELKVVYSRMSPNKSPGEDGLTSDICQTCFDVAPLLEVKMNNALKQIVDWGTEYKMRFAAHKTQAIVVTRKLMYPPRFELCGQTLELSDDLRVLSLTIDKSLSFRAHLDNVYRKTFNIFKMLSRAIRTHWGLNSEIMRLLYLVTVEPVVLYAASAWVPAADRKFIKKRLDHITRMFALKISRAHRTTSLTSKQASLYEIKRGKPFSELPGTVLEKRVSPFHLLHPSERKPMRFSSINNQKEADEIDNDWPRLYTDGMEIQKIVKDLSSNNVETGLHWIKAHAGIIGNERADDLAKAATKMKVAPAYEAFPLSYSKRSIRETTLNKWQARYTQASSGEITKIFFPEIKSAYRILTKTCTIALRTQLFTGHTGIKAYLNRFKLADDPFCTCDNVSPETIIHIMLKCPKYGFERYECECRMDLKLTKDSIKEAISHDNRRTHFLAFAERIHAMSTWGRGWGEG
ncbi:TRASSc9 protein [Operophtera brumata]|uniref:TRASSc9 protein n=1 Tax=Operophtera brumata TaxID=104452 RepID=A0A0L7KPW9_OPEBR|nr:TRASSc9 protein [Operophtera brumata]